MQAKEWRTADKSEWPRGEWDSEPDKMQFADEATGLPCLIVRGPSGSLCGYVGVAEGHRYFEKDYDGCSADVHGGLTFAGFCTDHSLDSFRKFQERAAAWPAEAARHPKGDAARLMREWADCVADYDKWLARSQTKGICHIPAAGEPDRVWWLGFDCAHLGDLSPAHESHFPSYEESYKDIRYVKREVRNLAEQLAA